MNTRQLKTATAIVFILSAIGMSLWLYEIVEVKGWYGLDWLNGQLYSPYILSLNVVFAFITPFLVKRRMTATKAIFTIIILYTVNVLCFEAGKRLCYLLYCRFCFWTTKDIMLLFFIGFMVFALLGVTYWFVTNKLIKKIKKINVAYIILLAICSIPLSLVTIQVNSGFGAQKGWVDAVKMGYPVFWITMMLGLSGIAISRQEDLQGV